MALWRRVAHRQDKVSVVVHRATVVVHRATVAEYRATEPLADTAVSSLDRALVVVGTLAGPLFDRGLAIADMLVEPLLALVDKASATVLPLAAVLMPAEALLAVAVGSPSHSRYRTDSIQLSRSHNSSKSLPTSIFPLSIPSATFIGCTYLGPLDLSPYGFG